MADNECRWSCSLSDSYAPTWLVLVASVNKKGFCGDEEEDVLFDIGEG